VISNTYETGESSKDFTESVIMIASNKKPNATNCSDHKAISLIAHIANVVASKHRRRIERKIEDVLAEDQFGFSRGKGNRCVILMLRTWHIRWGNYSQYGLGLWRVWVRRGGV